MNYLKKLKRKKVRKMCSFCNAIKRNHPSYIYCPMCGKNLNSLGFIPKYIICKSQEIDIYGRRKGLGTISTVNIGNR